MTLVSHIHKVSWLFFAAFALVFFMGTKIAGAEGSLSVTVTPPLFQITIGPGEKWSSTIKVVNNNPSDVAYYADVMNFEANGESGSSKFMPIIGETPAERSISLASWIQISHEPILIGAGQSREVPFTVDIPIDAAPGGHYAAILIGTQPGNEGSEGSVVKVSSFVSSLLFVRIKGDVHESGRIREFSTDKTLYQEPAANFSVRFENTGNTHLQPQGDITIFNMWGKERGKLLINQKSNFGNVLPKSTRKFEFSWKGEESAFDIGRYSALVTLGYGSDGKQNASAKIYFWVVPVVPVAMTLGSFVVFALIIMWFIRRYIRRALALSLQHAPISNVPQVPEPVSPTHPTRPIATLMEPLKEGVVDLRALAARKSQVPVTSEVVQEPVTVSYFAMKYKLFFVFIVVVAVGGMCVGWYFSKALTPKRSFQITDVTIQEEIPSSVTE
jgi:hypothetical protein